ncbi:MAG: ATP-binding protein [Nitrososphaeria archaeon]
MVYTLDKKYLCVSKDDKIRLYSVVQLRPKQISQFDRPEDVSSAEVLVSYRKAVGFFEGLYKANIPLLYIVSISAKPQSSIKKLLNIALRGSEENDEDEMFEQSVFAITWVEGTKSKMAALKSDLDQRTRILCTAASVGYDDFVPEVLTGNGLESFMRSIAQPRGSFDGSEEVEGYRLPYLLRYSPLLPTKSSTDAIPSFYIPNFEESGSDGIYLGHVRSSSGLIHKFFLRESDMAQHLCVIGMTGSGKSTTCKLILSQMMKSGKKVMVLDWHNEYADFLRKMGCTVIDVGKDNSFVLNPLDAISASDIYEHIALITDIFSEVYRFTSPQSFTFRSALMNLYGDKKGFTRFPTLSNLVDCIEQAPIRSTYDTETKTALLRRLLPLTQGQAGLALNGENTFSMDSILSNNVGIELGHFRDFETRAIFSTILLKMVYDFRLLSGLSSTGHVTVIEESRAIVPSRRAEDPPSIGEKMISELRKFGECMIFVAQFPTQISSEIIKNSGLRIVHRVSWLEDIRILRETLGLNDEQARFLSSLKTGETIVSVGRIRSPFLLVVDASSVTVGKEPSQVTFVSDKS